MPAVAWTATEGIIWVDGQVDGRGELSEGLPDRPLPERMRLGAEPSWINAGPEGVLADFRVYGRALGTDEIRAVVRERMRG